MNKNRLNSTNLLRNLSVNRVYKLEKKLRKIFHNKWSEVAIYSNPENEFPD